MVNFGEEFVLQIYRVPWLIWIQMLIFVLLLFIIYCVSFFSPSDISVEDRDSLASSSSHLSKAKRETAAANCVRVSESQRIKGEIVTNTRRRFANEEDMSEREGLSTKDCTPNYSHPCHIIRLARVFFLKCFGLGPDKSSPSSKQTRES